MMMVTTIFRRGRPFGGQRADDFRPRGPEDFRRNSRPGSGRGSEQAGGPGGGPGGPGGPPDGALVIELDRDVVLKELVPALIEKHFSAHDDTVYRVGIISKGDEPHVLYSSVREWKPEDIATPDWQLNLFGAPPPPPPNNGTPNINPGNRRAGRNRGPGPFARGGFQASLIATVGPFDKASCRSLERAVDQLRRFDLAISFGILLVLAAGLITVVVFSQRAHTPGRLRWSLRRAYPTNCARHWRSSARLRTIFAAASFRIKKALSSMPESFRKKPGGCRTWSRSVALFRNAIGTQEV